MIWLAAILHLMLPRSRSEQASSYVEMMRTTIQLEQGQPRLHRHALNGVLPFAAFMTFWATYAIQLQKEFDYGPAFAGLFGVTGLMGGAGASFAGRLVDKGQYRKTLAIACGLLISAFLILLLTDYSIVFMIVGLLMLDAGARLSHAANKSEAPSSTLPRAWRLDCLPFGDDSRMVGDLPVRPSMRRFDRYSGCVDSRFTS